MAEPWPGGRAHHPGHGYEDIEEQDAQILHAGVAHRLSNLALASLHVLDCKAGFRVAALIRANHSGILMLNNGHDGPSPAAEIASGKADLISFGVPFIASPDVPGRLRLGAPLNESDRATFYGGGERGFVDHPALPLLSAAA